MAQIEQLSSMSNSSTGIFEFIKTYYPEYVGDKEYPVSESIFFHKKTDDHWVLSNMSAAPLVVEGVNFRNSEHLFQVMKFASPESIKAVYQSKSPKMTAKHNQKLGNHRRTDWGSMIIDAMKFCLQLKYEQSLEFRNELDSTKGSYIVELQDNKTDTVSSRPNGWGVKTKGEKYVGPNIMGQLLMSLRDNGKLKYSLPSDALAFIELLK